MITYHVDSKVVALICQRNAMHYKIVPIGTYYEGRLIEEWFMERDELCTPCFEKAQKAKR